MSTADTSRSLTARVPGLGPEKVAAGPSLAAAVFARGCCRSGSRDYRETAGRDRAVAGGRAACLVLGQFPWPVGGRRFPGLPAGLPRCHGLAVPRQAPQAQAAAHGRVLPAGLAINGRGHGLRHFPLRAYPSGRGIVGCKIKGVRRLIEKLGEFSVAISDKEGRVLLGPLFLGSLPLPRISPS
jgi:hypothetical protein